MPKNAPLKISPNTPVDFQKMLTDAQAALADGKVTLPEVFNLAMDLLTLYRDVTTPWSVLSLQPEFHMADELLVCKLGKLPPQFDARTLRIEAYFDPAQIPVPDSFDFATGVTFPMWLNDRIGDCTCAASAGLLDVWTALTGAPSLVSDQDVLTAYSAVSGYDPRTGRNDNGALIVDVLKYWMQKGIGGHFLGAYGSVGNANLATVYAAIYVAEGLSIGIQLPEYCLQTDVWDAPSNVLAGGHDIILTGKRSDGWLLGRTWGGRIIQVSPRFLGAQVDELRFGIAKDQFNAAGQAGNHLDLGQMQADVESVAQMDTPPIPVPAPPPPVPPIPVPPAPPAPHGFVFHTPALPTDFFSVGIGYGYQLKGANDAGKSTNDASQCDAEVNAVTKFLTDRME